MQVNVTDILVETSTGSETKLGQYLGKVLLIVNVASKCGNTPQYKGLQMLQDKYKDRGFLVLGFPCNDFGAQEPGTIDEIKEFCSLTYGVNFEIRISRTSGLPYLISTLMNLSVATLWAARRLFEVNGMTLTHIEFAGLPN